MGAVIDSTQKCAVYCLVIVFAQICKLLPSNFLRLNETSKR